MDAIEPSDLRSARDQLLETLCLTRLPGTLVLDTGWIHNWKPSDKTVDAFILAIKCEKNELGPVKSKPTYHMPNTPIVHGSCALSSSAFATVLACHPAQVSLLQHISAGCCGHKSWNSSVGCTAFLGLNLDSSLFSHQHNISYIQQAQDPAIKGSTIGPCAAAAPQNPWFHRFRRLWLRLRLRLAPWEGPKLGCL